MKKIVMIAIASIIILAIGFSLVVANNRYDPFGRFKKINGVALSKDSVVFSTPGQKDKNEFIESEDLINDTPGKKLESDVLSLNDNKIGNSDKIVKKILLNQDGMNYNLTINYVKNGNRCMFLPVYDGQQYYIENIPNSQQSLLAINNEAYLIDIDKSTVNKLFKDSVLGIDKTEIKKMIKTEGQLLKWVDSPYVNLSGTKIIFQTNRKGVKDDNGDEQIWLKDLISGDEIPVYDGGAEFRAWDVDDNVYYRCFDKIIRINTNNNEVNIIYEGSDVENIVIAYPYLVIPSFEKIELKNVITGEIRDIKNCPINYVSNCKVSPDLKRIAFFAQKDSSNFAKGIVVFNIENNVFKSIYEYDDLIIDDYQWFDSNQVIVQTHRVGTILEDTYIINTNELDECIRKLITSCNHKG